MRQAVWGGSQCSLHDPKPCFGFERGSVVVAVLPPPFLFFPSSPFLELSIRHPALCSAYNLGNAVTSITSEQKSIFFQTLHFGLPSSY